IVDGGPTNVGLESTILKREAGGLRLLRPGGTPAEQIEAVAGVALERQNGTALEAPGMMASHYAPGARVRLDAAHVEPGEALLAFGPQPVAGSARAAAVRNLSPSGSLVEAAANLFAYLQELDRTGAGVIAVGPVPREGL